MQILPKNHFLGSGGPKKWLFVRKTQIRFLYYCTFSKLKYMRETETQNSDQDNQIMTVVASANNQLRPM